MCFAKKSSTLTVTAHTQQTPNLVQATSQPITNDNLTQATPNATPIEEQQPSNIVIGPSAEPTTMQLNSKEPVATDVKKRSPDDRETPKKSSRSKKNVQSRPTPTNEESNLIETAKIMNIDHVKNAKAGATKSALLSPVLPQPHQHSSEFATSMAPKQEIKLEASKLNKRKPTPTTSTGSTKTLP